jgi:hypothetical protein
MRTIKKRLDKLLVLDVRRECVERGNDFDNARFTRRVRPRQNLRDS